MLLSPQYFYPGTVSNHFNTYKEYQVAEGERTNMIEVRKHYDGRQIIDMFSHP